MKSMTGFGSATAADAVSGIGLKAEISSTNKKQFELKTSLPRELSPYEIPMRNLVSERISRGSVSLRVDFLSGSAPNTDFSRLLPVYNAAKSFQAANGIPGEITISDLLALPENMFSDQTDYSDPVCLKLLTAVVSEALDRLVEMRLHEGERLKANLLVRIDLMENTVKKIRPLAESLPQNQRERLLEKLKEFDIPLAPDDDRILKEIVIFADRLDVSEEITRLFCHFSHFRKLADSGNSVGRSLDFLVQEIFRECNTLGTKAASQEISPLVVDLKTELEKIREQVQTIE